MVTVKRQLAVGCPWPAAFWFEGKWRMLRSYGREHCEGIGVHLGGVHGYSGKSNGLHWAVGCVANRPFGLPLPRIGKSFPLTRSEAVNFLKALWINLTLLFRPKRRALVSELARREREKVDRLKNPSNYGPDTPDRPANVSEELSGQADAIEHARKVVAQRDALTAANKKAEKQNKSAN
jgi:hypothetical protein